MKILKITCVVILVIFALMIGIFLTTIYFRSIPPTEEKLLADFHTHRREFDQLRDMLQNDVQLLRLGKWGVETQSSVVPKIPPEGAFPVSRYEQYHRLLDAVGGGIAARDGSKDADLTIGLWAWGFAGNTRHRGVSWMAQPPQNQVSSLDQQWPSDVKGRIYRHIDSQWYLYGD